MDYSKLTVGTKVYYRGDSKNQPAFGQIEAVSSNRWSPVQYDIRLVSGERLLTILPTGFGGLEPGGHRFRLLTEADQPRYQREVEYWAQAAAELAEHEEFLAEGDSLRQFRER